MKMIVVLLVIYLAGGAFTYAKVYEGLTPPATPEVARNDALKAALQWPKFWLLYLEK